MSPGLSWVDFSCNIASQAIASRSGARVWTLWYKYSGYQRGHTKWSRTLEGLVSGRLLWLLLTLKYVQGSFRHCWYNLSNSLCSPVTCLILHTLFSKIIYSKSRSHEFMLMKLISSIPLALNYMAYLLLGPTWWIPHQTRQVCRVSGPFRHTASTHQKNHHQLPTLWWRNPLQH